MKVNFKTVLTIIVLSSVLGLTINFFSTKGIPLIAEKKTLSWADDALFNQTIPDANVPEKTASDIAGKPDIQEEIKEEDDQKPGKTAEEPGAEETPKEEKKEEPPLPTEATAINLQQAYRLYQQNTIFIDAREKPDFDYAHIKGAVNIPFDHFEDYKHLLNDIDKNSTIVTYCSGTDCDLSILLGNLLFGLGYKRTFIFFGGWNDWLEAGYPISPSPSLPKGENETK